MSTDYFFTNKTNTEVKRLDLLMLGKRLYDNCYIKHLRGKGDPNKTGSVSIYRYINNKGLDIAYTDGNWTWFYQDEEMTWAKDFGESNSEPLLDKIAEWLDINWHSEHSELPEIKTFIEQHDLWSAWREASHSHG